MGYLINIDNGGTLTDIWAMSGSRWFHTKTLTTPYDLSKCFFEGLLKISGEIYGRENLPLLIQETDHIRYSTTQGTNALVTRNGPRLGLILDSEFKAARLLESEAQESLFNTLVGERLVCVDHKLPQEPYEKAVVEAINRLQSQGAQRIVVALCGDYGAREMRFGRVAIQLFPRHLLGAVPMLYAGSLSSDPDLVRRCWTALINGFLHPAMERFLYNAENRMRELRARNPLLIYRNDGFAGRVAKTVALKTHSSGPRAGLESALAYARHYDLPNLLTMDVGGTTTDIGAVIDGKVLEQRYGHIEGVECSLPTCHIESVGIGGGSIFRVDRGELLVGPDSVGGVPGPACFAMGGKEATITDALLVLGLLDPETYFGGDMNLNAEKALQVISAQVGEPLDLSTLQAARRMVEVWSDAVASGLRAYTDIDSDMVLTAFGGGGPMVATTVADAAGIGTVLIPRLAAVFSAHGIGFSNIAHQSDALLNSVDDLAEFVVQLTERVAKNMFSEGFTLDQCELSAWLEIDESKYFLDPEHPEFPAGLDPQTESTLVVRAVKPVTPATLPEKTGLSGQPPRISATRKVFGAEQQDIPVLNLDEQQPGVSGHGPVIIEEQYWTCLVDAGWCYQITDNRDVLLKRQEVQA